MKYNILYIDPPWIYKDRKKIRKDGKTAKRGIGAGNMYDCMPFSQICDLPIYHLAHDNCALFCWITSPYADRIHEIFEGWDFRFIKISGFCWKQTGMV